MVKERTGKENVRNIHVMSAGKGLAGTFQTAVKKYPVDGVVIVTDVDMKKHQDDGEKNDIVESIQSVMETCRRLDWPCEVISVTHGSLEQLRDRIMEMFIQNSGDRYFFNVTNGNKILSLGLFMISLWIGGETYYIEKGSKEVVILQVPKMHLEDVLSNPNNERILIKILPGEMPMKELFHSMENEYRPYSEGDKKVKRSLSRGTLSKWVSHLEEWGLVDVSNPTGNRRDKVIRITSDGRFALLIIEASRAKDFKKD